MALVASLMGGWGRKGSIRVLEIFKGCFRVISINKPSEKWLATQKFGGNPIAVQLSFSLTILSLCNLPYLVSSLLLFWAHAGDTL